MSDFDAASALAKLLDRVGPPTAIIWVAALAAFIAGALKEARPSLSSGWLVTGGLLFFVGCGFYCWRERTGTSVEYVDDPPLSVWGRLANFRWGYILCSAASFLLAIMCGYLLWSNGHP